MSLQSLWSFYVLCPPLQLPVEPPRLGHPAQHDPDPSLIAGAAAAGVPAFGVGERGGELGGFAVGEGACRLAVVVPGRGLGAVDAGAELGDVQVELEDP